MHKAYPDHRERKSASAAALPHCHIATTMPSRYSCMLQPLAVSANRYAHLCYTITTVVPRSADLLALPHLRVVFLAPSSTHLLSNLPHKLPTSCATLSPRPFPCSEQSRTNPAARTPPTSAPM